MKGDLSDCVNANGRVKYGNGYVKDENGMCKCAPEFCMDQLPSGALKCKRGKRNQNGYCTPGDNECRSAAGRYIHLRNGYVKASDNISCACDDGTQNKEGKVFCLMRKHGHCQDTSRRFSTTLERYHGGQRSIRSIGGSFNPIDRFDRFSTAFA